ncbi:MAG: EFR1 family ferrodoxin [Erysipelotrichaceae bacterium]|nr:EFR1 family ferrodoxin [Erysipelotrichaceae bacterium]
MRYLLIYYTGTNNTQYLCKELEKKLKNDGHIVDIFKIKSDSDIIDTSSYDYIGLSYPIYGFNSPMPFNKYLRKLKFNKNQKYFIFKNSGEVFAMNNTSSRVIKRIMKKKKSIFVGEYHFVMPYNIHFRFEDEFIYQAFKYNEKLLEVMLYNINHDILYYPKSNLLYEIASFFVSIQKIGGNVNSFFYKVDNKKCNKCKLCIANCPHNNIKIKNGTIKFSHHCDMCMACSFFCKQDAISIGFLNNWKVNGAYDFNKIENMQDDIKPYITSNSKGFYKCFIKYFENIDNMYTNIKNMGE